MHFSYLFRRYDDTYIYGKTRFSPSRYGAIREKDTLCATRRARYHVIIGRAFSYKLHSDNIRRHAHTGMIPTDTIDGRSNGRHCTYM